MSFIPTLHQVMYYQGEGGLPQSDDMAIKLYREVGLQLPNA